MSFFLAMGHALSDGLILCLEIVLVVAPLMLGYELAKAYGVFERPWPGVGPVLKRLGLSPGAMVPLLAGIFLGLLYGAGILVSVSREQGLPKNERLALAVFLVTCHAVVEDTAIFMLLGGSAFWILLPRLVLAVGLTAWLARRGGRRAADPSPR
ncbi:MAG: nucleoside recognition domain-containing protein [Thermodesulfobacteriota bacterium]